MKTEYTIKNPQQLKALIRNMSKKNNIVANTILQNYVMERFLERVSISKYSDNFILKGGFLIAAMVGIDMRSTMDMDTTIKGVPVNLETIQSMINEIIKVPLNDSMTFEIVSINPIHEEGAYEDYRLLLKAHFFNMRINMKIDITTGDVIIPREMNYTFKLMFEERCINIKAYNLNTILAEKIESIIVRNVTNTRARDFYDIYILFSTRREDIDDNTLEQAIFEKAQERNTTEYIDNYSKYVNDIRNSTDLLELWNSYQNKYSYADGIDFNYIIDMIEGVFSK